MPIMQKTERYSSRNHKAKSQQALNTLGQFFTKTTDTVETLYFSGTFIKIIFDLDSYFLYLYDTSKNQYNLVLNLRRDIGTATIFAGNKYDKQGNVSDETKEFINAYMYELANRFTFPRVRVFRERLDPKNYQSWVDVDGTLRPFDRSNDRYTLAFSSTS